MPCGWRRAAALGAALLVVGTAHADDLAGLLTKLGTGSAPEGKVEALAWVERDSGGQALVIELRPRGAARLLADPGITVEPIPQGDVRWQSDRLELGDAAGGYLTAPPTLRLPFAGTPARVGAHVAYAYCLADYQCLFGAAEVSAAAPPSG